MDKKLLKVIIPAAVWLTLWAVLAAVVGKELILPSPASVARTLLALAGTAAFWREVGMSLLRVGAGFLLGAILGTGLGVVTASSRWGDLLLAPALGAVRTVPVVSFILLLYFWFPTGWVPVVVSALMALPVVWRSAAEGWERTDPQLLELAGHYALGSWRTLKLARLPAALPSLAAGWETALGLTWKAGAAAEVLCQPRWGLGAALQRSKSTLDIPALFAWTAVIVALSGLSGWLLKRLLRKGGRA